MKTNNDKTSFKFTPKDSTTFTRPESLVDRVKRNSITSKENMKVTPQNKKLTRKAVNHFTIKDGKYYLEVELNRKEGKLRRGLFKTKEIYSASLFVKSGGGLSSTIKAYYLNKEGKAVNIVKAKDKTTTYFEVNCKDISNNLLRVYCEANIKIQGFKAHKCLKASVSLNI